MANKIVREIIHAKGIDIGIYTKDYYQILYLIFDYPHKHYTFKHFEV